MEKYTAKYMTLTQDDGSIYEVMCFGDWEKTASNRAGYAISCDVQSEEHFLRLCMFFVNDSRTEQSVNLHFFSVDELCDTLSKMRSLEVLSVIYDYRDMKMKDARVITSTNSERIILRASNRLYELVVPTDPLVVREIKGYYLRQITDEDYEWMVERYRVAKVNKPAEVKLVDKDKMRLIMGRDIEKYDRVYNGVDLGPVFVYDFSAGWDRDKYGNGIGIT